jgi:hypothetical protein
MNLVYSLEGSAAPNFKISGLAGCMNSTTLLKVEKTQMLYSILKSKRQSSLKKMET